MSGYIRFAVSVMMVLFNMASASVTKRFYDTEKSSRGILSTPLLDNRSETDFITSKEMEWKNEEIETGKWCGTINRLPDQTLYQFCSQSKSGGQWNCNNADVWFGDIEVPDSMVGTVKSVRKSEISFCHEYQFVEGTNVAIFVKVPDGQKWRYLRTERAFVPKLRSSIKTDHVSSRRHLFILIGCVSVAAILLCVLGYFLYQRRDEEPNEQSQPNNEDV